MADNNKQHIILTKKKYFIDMLFQGPDSNNGTNLNIIIGCK